MPEVFTYLTAIYISIYKYLTVKNNQDYVKTYTTLLYCALCIIICIIRHSCSSDLHNLLRICYQ